MCTYIAHFNVLLYNKDMNMYMESFGERIKIARLRLGLTQQELVDILNNELEGEEIVERSILSRWENNKNFPRNPRKKILEEILDIDLGSAPLRRETFSAYLTNRDEIEESTLLGLQNCSEIWLSNILEPRSIWRELPETHQLLQDLRHSPSCYFREIIYIRTMEDLMNVKKFTAQRNPNHDIRIRIAPGHAFPVLLAPKSRYGVLLSGFHNNITSVGLELNGAVAGFNEHYLRHIWNKATAILENGSFIKENFLHATQVLEQLGGEAKNEFEIK